MSVLRPHRPGIPVPRPTALTQPYWDGCARGELWFQSCEACGAAVFDPQHVCRTCRSDRLTWRRSSGHGLVSTWSVVWRPPSPAFHTPYAVGIIDVAEGYQMIANLVDCELDELRLELPVKAVFHPIGEGFWLPYFAPRRAAERPLASPPDRTPAPTPGGNR